MRLLTYLLFGLLAYYVVRQVRRLLVPPANRPETHRSPRPPTTINPQDIQDAEFRDVDE